jgi:hypothetical protein
MRHKLTSSEHVERALQETKKALSHALLAVTADEFDQYSDKQRQRIADAMVCLMKSRDALNVVRKGG